MREKIKNGGYVNGIFFRIEVIREMYYASIEWRGDYIDKYSGKRRLPANVKRYIKTTDAKILTLKKILDEYDESKARKFRQSRK